MDDGEIGSAVAARRRIRRGEFTGQTSGIAPGRVQGNIAILPADWADEFLRFCLQNPKPCPLLAVGRSRPAGAAELGRGHRHPQRRAALPRLRAKAARSRRPPTSRPIGATIS